MGKLTQKKIREASKRGLYSDGGTLYLNVALGGSKSWVQRITIKGRQRDIGLGPLWRVSLHKARKDAHENREVVYDGGDPLTDKKRTRETPTFREAALKLHKEKTDGGELGTTAAIKWKRGLEQHTFDRIGDMRLDAISQSDVLACLTPIWTKKPAIAVKVRQAIRAIFSWALSHHYVTTNPAGEAISGALTKRRNVTHHRFIPFDKIVDALDAIAASDAGETVKLLLYFQTLTAVRPGEAHLAVWDEIDMETATWTIPAERMKKRREHRVPLSPAAMDVLRQAMPYRNNTAGLVFPSITRPNKALSDSACGKLMRDLEMDGTPHGMRSTFGSWCDETGKVRDIADAALAHVVPGVKGAYFRTDLFDRRRDLMDAWAAFLTGETGKVVSLHR